MWLVYYIKSSMPRLEKIYLMNERSGSVLSKMRQKTFNIKEVVLSAYEQKVKMVQ